jgi:hypothetical protein
MRKPPATYRIYFDENAGDADNRFDLGIPGSLRDISRIASQIKDGPRVMLYDGEALEVEAELQFDRTRQRWMGRPVWDTIRRLDIGTVDHALA